MSGTGLPTTGTGTLTFDSGTKRTGDLAYKFDSTAGNLAIGIKPTFTANATIYGSVWLNFTNLPGSAVAIVQLSAGGSALLQVKITSGGALQLFQNTTQVGSDSSALSTGTWYCIQWYGNINASGNDDISLRLDGVTVASGNGAYWASGSFSDCSAGWIDAPGASKVMYADDLCINSGSGIRHNAWPSLSGGVLLSLPTSDNADGNWIDGHGGNGANWECVNNIPPAGLDEVSQTSTSAIEHFSSNGSGALSQYDANMESYTAAGLPAGHRVALIRMIVAHAEDRATGSNNGALQIVSNPAEAAETAFVFGLDAGAAGTYPTNWRTAWTAITEYPSVAAGTAPVARVAKRTATTRPVACCFMGILFWHERAAVPLPPRPLRVWARR